MALLWRVELLFDSYLMIQTCFIETVGTLKSKIAEKAGITSVTTMINYNINFKKTVKKYKVKRF